MGTVQQHQVAAFTGPNDGETATGALLRANPDALREKFNAHDEDATIHVQSSTLASRPAAGTEGRFWLTQDGSEAPKLWYDDGADWVAAAVIPGAGALNDHLQLANAKAYYGTNSAGVAVHLASMTAGNVMKYGQTDYVMELYAANLLQCYLQGTERVRFDVDATAGNTALMLYDVSSASIRRVKKKLFSALVAGDEVLVFA